MTDEQYAGRRRSDAALTKLTRELAKLVKVQEQHAKAFAEHVILDRERNGRIGKLEVRADALERGADYRTQRLDQVAEAVLVMKARSDERREIASACGKVLLKAWPILAAGIGAGAGWALVGLSGVLSGLGVGS